MTFSLCQVCSDKLLEYLEEEHIPRFEGLLPGSSELVNQRQVMWYITGCVGLKFKIHMHGTTGKSAAFEVPNRLYIMQL